MDAALRALKSGVRGTAREKLQGAVAHQASLRSSEAPVENPLVHLPAALDFFGDAAPDHGKTQKSEKAPRAPTHVKNLAKPSKELQSALSAPLANALASLGITALTPVQRRVLPIFADNDVLAVAPTGSGKTYAYALPLLIAHESTTSTATASAAAPTSHPRALVLVPTRELAAQVHRVVSRVIRAAGMRIRIREVASKGSVATLRDAVAHIVIATPMSASNALRAKLLDIGHVRHVVLDEADRLLDDGFLEQVDGVMACAGADATVAPRVHMFSATLPGPVELLARTLLKKPAKVVVSGGAYGGAAAVTGLGALIHQKFTFVGGRGEQGKVLAVRTLLKQGLKPPILLFVQSRDRAAQLFRELVYEGISVDAIHADRSQAARASAIARFREGSLWLLIATDVLARGLDFLGVNTVINYDLPTSATAYVHRIGRTGRNGRSGEAITLFTEEDAAHLPAVLKIAKASGADVPQWALALKATTRREVAKRLEKRPPKRKRVGGPNAPVIGKRARKARLPQTKVDDTENAGAGDSVDQRKRKKRKKNKKHEKKGNGKGVSVTKSNSLDISLDEGEVG